MREREKDSMRANERRVYGERKKWAREVER